MKDITIERITEGLKGAGLSCMATEAGVVVALTSRKEYENPLLVRHLEERQVISIVVPNLHSVPEALRPEAAELVTRINFQTLVGNFELDHADGEVRFSHAIPVREAGVKVSQIMQVIGCAAWSVDRYLGAFRRLGAGLSARELLDAADRPGSEVSLDDLRRALEDEDHESHAA